MQSHDVAPSLYCTVISIDSPHMHKDGSNYLKFLLEEMQCTQNLPQVELRLKITWQMTLYDVGPQLRIWRIRKEMT